MPSKSSTQSRIIWIECKGDDGIVGPARIGRVTFSKSGKSLYYRGDRFVTLAGQGFKSNYMRVGTHEHYWISRCRKDGRDALYNTDIVIDDEVQEEYWTEIRKKAENVNISCFQATGKTTR
ncbi:MAG TPA: 1-deoxy-D-xylulose-5-phosphate synthase [Planctomycetaceae bacterium]|nr:1-deoxy-D-xylulose-5-phosphate synthase [Planctomycetaceae bacterium]